MRSPLSIASLTCRHVSVLGTLRCSSGKHFLAAIPSRSHSTLEDTTRPDVFGLLDARGYIKDVAGDRNVLQNLLRERPVGFYAGIDPTAPSLHLGHLLPLMVLFWLHAHGHNVVSLIGGATAQIGDPSGRLTSRAKATQSTHATNTESLTQQVASLWEKAEAYSLRHGFEAQQYGKRKLLNNKDWLLQLNIIDFLRSLGSSMRVGAMLGRDTVRNKMEKGDGMSFAELTYPLLQGWDWWHMFQKHGVQVQIGGSDQYGNIVAGLDAVKAITQSLGADEVNAQWSRPDGTIKQDHNPMGLTTPLLTTAGGEKFGKSAGNAVWLNPEMTSPFDLYGFLLRTADDDVERYLSLFTFVSQTKIAEVMSKHKTEPGLRTAQHLLAAEVLELVHGQQEAEQTAQTHRRLRNLSHAVSQASDDMSPTLDGTERTLLPRSLVASAPFARILYHAGLVSTRSEGARLIRGGGAYVASSHKSLQSTNTGSNFVAIKDLSSEECTSITGADLLIIRLGKWKVQIIEIVDDNEYNQAGLDAPGWQEWKAEHISDK